MKIIIATGGEEVYVDAEDYEFVNRHNWFVKQGYAITRMNGKDLYMHRMIFGKIPAGMVVDHVDRDKLNNRKGNLRPASHVQNVFNSNAGEGVGVSHYVGVSRKRGKWMASCSIKDKDVYIGIHDDEIECAKMRDAFVYRLRGELGFLNFPDEIPLYSVWEFPKRLHKHF